MFTFRTWTETFYSLLGNKWMRMRIAKPIVSNGLVPHPNSSTPHNGGKGISRNWNTYAHFSVIVVLSHIYSFQYSPVFILHFCFFHSLQTMRMNCLKIHRNHSLQTAINFQTNPMATRTISTEKRTRKMKEMQMPTKKLKKQQLAIASSPVSTSPLHSHRLNI